jgi:hypothetical protein
LLLRSEVVVGAEFRWLERSGFICFWTLWEAFSEEEVVMGKLSVTIV